jgi:hypothetical protein
MIPIRHRLAEQASAHRPDHSIGNTMARPHWALPNALTEIITPAVAAPRQAAEAQAQPLAEFPAALQEPAPAHWPAAAAAGLAEPVRPAC